VQKNVTKENTTIENVRKHLSNYFHLFSFFFVFFMNDFVKRAKKHVNKPIKEKETYEQLSSFFFVFFTNDFLKRAKI
jgi:hypothetical protein